MGHVGCIGSGGLDAMGQESGNLGTRQKTVRRSREGGDREWWGLRCSSSHTEQTCKPFGSGAAGVQPLAWRVP